MALILLAIGDRQLRGPARRYFEHRGHGVVIITRPLAALTVGEKVRWEAAFVDDTPLGRGALSVLATPDRGGALLVGLGLQDERLDVSVAFPLGSQPTPPQLEHLVEARIVPPRPRGRLRLDPARRLAITASGEALLTRTEYRLLALLFDQSPREVPLDVILQGVWGFTEGKRTSDLVRAHVRNLRRKLEQIGLGDVVRSRRGRGYALVL